MKVLLVTHENPEQPVGGLGIFIREYSRTLRMYADVRVLWLDYEGEALPGRNPEDVDWVVTPVGQYPSHTPEVRALDLAQNVLWQVFPKIMEFMPDVIHCNDRQSFMPFREFNNVVYSSHLVFTDLCGRPGWDDNLLLEHKYETWAVKKAFYTLAYSQFQRKVLQGRVDPQSRPLVLPLGADLSSYYRTEKSGGPIQIIFYGRMEGMQKGFDQFITAAKKVKERWGSQISLRCYGRGDLPTDYPKGIFDAVEFLDGATKVKALSETDIVVMPSTYEPFGLAGLEALASGCLLLATEGLGMDEYLLSGKNYVPIESSAGSILETLNHVVEHWPDYQEIRNNGPASVKMWTWDRCVRAHLPVYESTGSQEKKYNLLSSPKALTYQEQYQGFWNQDPAFLTEGLKEALIKHVPVEVVVPRSYPWERGIWETISSPGLGLECLAAQKDEFKFLLLAGKLEFAYEPGLALKEALRVTGGKLYLLVSIGLTIDRQRVAFDSLDELTAWIKKCAGVAKYKVEQRFDENGVPLSEAKFQKGWVFLQFSKDRRIAFIEDGKSIKNSSEDEVSMRGFP